MKKKKAKPVTPEEPRAIVVSFNWKTNQILFQRFDGEKAADDAAGWAHHKSFLWRDFPAKDGWEHFPHWNKTAGEFRGERIAQELGENGVMSEWVPK
jgi:hypothetical protein